MDTIKKDDPEAHLKIQKHLEKLKKKIEDALENIHGAKVIFVEKGLVVSVINEDSDFKISEELRKISDGLKNMIARIEENYKKNTI